MQKFLIAFALFSIAHAMPNPHHSICNDLLSTEALTRQTISVFDRWKLIEDAKLTGELSYQARRRTLTSVYELLREVKIIIDSAEELAGQQQTNFFESYQVFGKVRPWLIRGSQRQAFDRARTDYAGTARIINTLDSFAGYLRSVWRDLRHPIKDAEFRLLSFEDYVRVWVKIASGVDLAPGSGLSELTAPGEELKLRSAVPARSSPDHESDELEGLFELTTVNNPLKFESPKALGLRALSGDGSFVFIVFPGYDHPSVAEKFSKLLGSRVKCRGTYLPEVNMLIQARCESF
jgi:hypothetical protein